ncbi:MAG: efflux RND transporter periplasmic adaptor subunit [Reyranella sp.]|uniref:efflux RND transporter periplasmic adaptor subunit n=1 Tax=Reyranella sp. TaxID=1929291 RepID=UPI001AC21A4C|nr:efflux RND transporter periplasmic adaptor subunit [Reyranella sp.]MBN9086420.1 efflux RND transporter periplasmic adaptor subunit [Reyranella sp.]
MRLVRWAVLAVVAVVLCGAAWQYRSEVAQRLGLGTPASAAESGSSPAASAQPQGRRGRANLGGPIPVVTTAVVPKSMPIVVEAVGTVQAIASVQIKPRLDSQIMKLLVEEGALVKEGDLLFELDQRTLKAQLAQIEAQIRKDQAQVAQAKRDTVRSEDLVSKGAATVVARDTNMTALKAAEAQLESDEAMRQNILAQLSYTEIRAPVSGRIGSIPNKVGTTVRVADNTATAVLATINQVDPIYVQFAIPQVYLPELRAAMAKAPVVVNAIVDERHKQSGAVAFIENTVDPMTGTVMAKAKIANANEGLWPGQFIKAEIVLGVESSALPVPAPAVMLGPQGPYVFVVKGNVAEVRQVSVKRTQAGETVVGTGLSAGEQVVVDGQLRLVNGAAVAPKPATNEAPKAPAPRG